MAKILIIDDELQLRETVCELLSFSGFEVEEARNGKEGLHKVEMFVPDLIMCDNMMPIMNGYDFLEAYFLTDYTHIPVLFISAKVSTADQEKALALGAKGYFCKPFVFKELLQTILQYVEM